MKSDNTLLVHQPENASPINYMKSGTHFELAEDDGHLVLEARHRGLKEYMDIEIYRVYDAMQRVLDDGQPLELVGTEADMSDMIKDNPGLIADDFKPLSREEHTKFGFIDVFGHDGDGNLVIIECKRYSAGLDAVQQLRRYVEKINQLKDVAANGVIASPEITDNAKDMLHDWGYSWVRVEPPKRLERFNKDQASLGDFT
jgi:RecB family endonuclease NucS